MNRRSIGFTTLVHDFEATLFNRQDLGIVDSGVRATQIDLGIPDVPSELNPNRPRARLSHFIWGGHARASDLLAVIRFECPSWFEPTKRRLALNDLCWLDRPHTLNQIDDFDPWSQLVLLSAFKQSSMFGSMPWENKVAYS